MLFCCGVQAQNTEGVKSMDDSGQPSTATVTVLQKVGLDQHLNAQLPLDAAFHDEAGNNVTLGQYFHQRPVILTLVYYDCAMLCGQVLNGLVGSLNMLSLRPGKDFDLVTVSIDPGETPAQAKAKKDMYLKRYLNGGPADAAGWHFLTGAQPEIDALAKTIGFRYARVQGPDGKFNQFAHASAIIVATPEGKLAQYYYGIEFSPKDLRLGLVEASHEKIGSLVDAVLLYCYHYDPTTGKYSAIVIRIVRLGGIITVLALGTFMALMFRRDFQQKSAGLNADLLNAGRMNAGPRTGRT